MKSQLLQTIESMTIQQLYNEVYRDHLTGALNRKAFDMDDRHFVCIVDLDSLKYVNDELGYRYGDTLIKVLSAQLIMNFGEDNVYRLGRVSDEFAIKTNKPMSLSRKLLNIQKFLPVFSFGFGLSMTIADQCLKKNKADRISAGMRSERGERPDWFEDLTEMISRCVA